MHPAGIKFGLTHDMLQLRGADVVLSDKLLEYISAAARRQLNGKRIDGSELLDHVINRGLARMKVVARQEAKGESTAFYVKIEVVLFETIYPYAERAGIGYRQGRTFYFTRDFAGELSKSKKSLRRAADAYGYEKVLFLACYDAVVSRCKRVVPDDVRHADLIALCMFKAYDAIMMNSFMERFGTG